MPSKEKEQVKYLGYYLPNPLAEYFISKERQETIKEGKIFNAKKEKRHRNSYSR